MKFCISRSKFTNIALKKCFFKRSNFVEVQENNRFQPFSQPGNRYFVSNFFFLTSDSYIYCTERCIKIDGILYLQLNEI